MRLTQFEISVIKQSASEIFGSDVQVFLFGSRVDDTKKVETSICISKLKWVMI
jgi:hypothetical protein